MRAPISTSWKVPVDTSSLLKPSELRHLYRPTVLVVGASGILKPAALYLLGDGLDVIGVARSRPRLAELAQAANNVTQSAALHVLQADAREIGLAGQVERLIDQRRLRLDAVLVYGPATTDAVVERLLLATDCPVELILTSRWADPTTAGHEWSLSDLPEVEQKDRDRLRRLVLGWRRRNGISRWHDAVQISAAALDAITTSGDQLLGTVTPWSERPA